MYSQGCGGSSPFFGTSFTAIFLKITETQQMSEIDRCCFAHERICEFGSMSSYYNIAFQAPYGLLDPLALRSRSETNYLYDSST